jgi:four helix bundle protein
MGKVTSYRDLLVWQEAMHLVEECYRLTTAFPRAEEFGLRAQIRRAAIPIPSNIAERHSRHHAREFVQFLFVALGSVSELETQIELALRLKYLQAEETRDLVCACQEIGRMLNGLKNAISRYKGR